MSLIVITGFSLFAGAEAAESKTDKTVYWRPVRDEVYLQEAGRQIVTETPVLSLGVSCEDVYVGSESGLGKVVGDSITPVEGIPGPVIRIVSAGGVLWMCAGDGLYRLGDAHWLRVAEGSFVDVCENQGVIYVASAKELLRWDGSALVPVSGGNEPPGAIRRLASYSETLYCLSSGQLALYDGKAFDAVNVTDWGKLPSVDTRDLLTLGSRLYIATGKGLGLLRGMALTVVTGKDGLCVEDAVCLGEGFDRELWIGTSHGAIRAVRGENEVVALSGIAGQYHYFEGKRWLPGNQVNAIARTGQTVYLGTEKGIGIIEYQSYTLEKKADYFERWLEEMGHKRMGFVHMLGWNRENNEWLREVSDNDGGWTAQYLAAQSFKYAVTKDEKVRAVAVETFRSLKWLEEITSIRGFPARAIWGKGETGIKAAHGSGGYPAEWVDSADGNFEWKADTSSDEVDAHFYATAVFYELAANDEEKALAREHLSRIATHIYENGWVLRDLDGEPTKWARWDPEYFASLQGFYARGLNGLEVLAYMRTAQAVTGDPKFEEAYQKLVEMGYPDYVLRQKHTFPPDFVTHFDDRLAFLAYYNLLRYEKDPKLRSIYMRSMERSWEVKRVEETPWFNFIYGGLTGNDCEVGKAVSFLRDWPLDVVSHTTRNSHRADLDTPAGYTAYAGGTRAVSPRERGAMRWDRCTLQYDSGAHGMMVEDPTALIEGYWMGRYFGMILPPDTKDPALLTSGPLGLKGSAPYNGPPRPW